MILECLHDFWENYIANSDIEIYNEFSLQHELGIYLRNKLPNFKVQFERNADFFIKDKNIKTRKHEIDIVIFKDNEKYAVELKYPRHGQYPVRMFKFIEDIQFMEELKSNGFNKTFTMAIVDEADGKKFYSGNSPQEIYKYFRSNGNKILHGKVDYPCNGKVIEPLYINGYYSINWLNLPKELRGYILETNND